jgi:hypothetical protein
MGLIGSGNQNQVGGVDKGIAGLMGGLSGLFGKQDSDKGQTTGQGTMGGMRNTSIDGQAYNPYSV